MLTVDFEDLMLELDDGTIKHVGAPTAAASVTLHHATEASAREFGDSRVKLAFEDDGGNDVEVALPPAEVESLVAGVERLREEGRVLD